jgi:hypothetical protein
MKKYFKKLLLVFVTILIFTGGDYIIHQLRAEFSVPEYYFRNKIIFGTILGFIILIFIENMKNRFWQSFIFSFLIATLLQTRYTIEGYDFFGFVLPFLFIHFFILWLASYLILFKNKN